MNTISLNFRLLPTRFNSDSRPVTQFTASMDLHNKAIFNRHLRHFHQHMGIERPLFGFSGGASPHLNIRSCNLIGRQPNGLNRSNNARGRNAGGQFGRDMVENRIRRVGGQLFLDVKDIAQGIAQPNPAGRAWKQMRV